VEDSRRFYNQARGKLLVSYLGSVGLPNRPPNVRENIFFQEEMRHVKIIPGTDWFILIKQTRAKVFRLS
jgi:hypothetical protein